MTWPTLHQKAGSSSTISSIRGMQCVAVCYSVFSVLQCVEVFYSVWQCLAVCRRVLHRVAACCSVLHLRGTNESCHLWMRLLHASWHMWWILKRPIKETYKRDLQKRPIVNFDTQKRPTKKTYKRDLQKRPTKETYKRDLQKRRRLMNASWHM